MHNISTETELFICLDITSRMGLYAMAKSLDAEEINGAFNDISIAMQRAYPQEPQMAAELVQIYQQATINLHNLLQQRRK